MSNSISVWAECPECSEELGVTMVVCDGPERLYGNQFAHCKCGADFVVEVRKELQVAVDGGTYCEAELYAR